MIALPFLSSLVPLLLAPPQEQTSGRPAPPEQTCYDVRYYGLELTVDPERREIEGTLTMRAWQSEASDSILLDLDHRLKVTSVTAGDPAGLGVFGGADEALPYSHRDGELRITSDRFLWGADSVFEVVIAFAGEPREAPNPPWDPGFVWSETPGGSPWIATACQSSGADLWWPCKDQPDDEADTMDITVTVPAGLVCASNGRLVSVTPVGEDGKWVTYAWHVSTPINNYGVALNIAPYETIEREYESVAGETIPITYWVLPENVEKGKELMDDVLRQMAFMEKTFGPYPFRADKYGIAETPHLGMEHQTIIAYGNEYKGNPWGKQWGFDMLHYHEFAHEWWANLVTCPNWNDMWIHEGFATYAQALYVEELHGNEAYHEELASYRAGLNNEHPVAPRKPQTTTDIYFGGQGNDVYSKGACILHTLRYLLGDEDFRTALRRMAYADSELEATTDGSACRFATTDDFQAVCEAVSGQELGWFFEVYLRQPALPKLVTERRGTELELRWETPDELPFPMPVEVRVGSELFRVEMPDGRGSLSAGGMGEVEVDPLNWILKEE